MTTVTHAALLHRELLTWYSAHQRALPWREPRTTPWGVLVSEVMSQQTPVDRVAPRWREWMERWPTPAALAAASPAEVLRAWDRLGYPRRALRLREAAQAVVDRHGGVLPDVYDELVALPGVGDYTASAVLAFAYGQRIAVLDTNVRRVISRAVIGQETASGAVTRVERGIAEQLLPDEPQQAATWSVAVMEFGALVCTARNPLCGECPVREVCEWFAAGRPETEKRRPSQRWHGTDRQVRGAVMGELRASASPLDESEVEATLAARLSMPDGQFERCVETLIADGLIERSETSQLSLPA